MPEIMLEMDEIEDTRERMYPGNDLADIRLFRDYASGKHAKVTSIEMRKALGSTRPNTVADNILDLVLRTTAGRLNFEAWEVDGNEEAESYLADVYAKSRLMGLQFDTHYATLRDGMTACSLQWRPPKTRGEVGRVSIHREPWWDGLSGVFVAYDDYDDPIWAVRDWTEYVGKREVARRTIYYPDLILRFAQDIRSTRGRNNVRGRTTPGSWKPYALPGDPEGSAGQIPWVKSDGSPLGLPIVPFANAVADSGNYGRSDIDGLIGIQDDVNQIGIDITAAAMFTGFQMYWATGQRVDEAKQVVGPGRMLSSDNPDSRFGVFPPGAMDSLIGAYESKRQTIATDTATPMHLISGQWPSGEALMRSEMPLVDKVIRLGAVLAPSWVQLGHRSTELENAFGVGGIDEEALISARYSPPERLDKMAEIGVQQATVNLYASLSSITDPELLVATGIVDEKESTAIMDGRAERAAAFTVSEAEF